MSGGARHRARSVLVWVSVLAVACVPVIAAFYSPLLAWREPVYISAGFAGIVALALLMFQPLLVLGYLPGLTVSGRRLVHRVIGVCLVTTVLIHVAGLWVTSPPDVRDALLFVSPTPFAAWGVIAMWAVLVSALIAAFRRQLPIGLRGWRRLHRGLAVVIVLGSVVHAIQIQGTMETLSKIILCGLIVLATGAVMVRLMRRTGRAR